jgi:hypothetical protein
MKPCQLDGAMTKLVVVLAVVVLVILVVVIVAVRNMRAEDPDEFADQLDGRARGRGSQDGRDVRYDRGEPAGRPRARASRSTPPAARPAGGRQGADGYRTPAADRGFDDGRGQRRGHGSGDRAQRAQRVQDGRGYGDRRGAAVPPGPEKRRRGDDGTLQPEETRPAARARRRSTDSSEWDSSEWEKLSDVDYWAELASDKPLTTTAQPASQRSAAPGSGPKAGPAPGREPGTLAAPGRAGFAAAPVPVDQAPDRQRAPAATNGDRGRTGHRQPASADGDRGLPDRQRPPASGNGGPSGRQHRPRLPDARASEPGQRLLDGLNGDRGGYLSAGPASLPLPVIRDVSPARQDRRRDVPPAPPARQDRPRLDPDDDPLTSPSFPKVPASDGRSYHNGRAATPPGDSRATDAYLAPTQQFASYDAPTGQYPTPQRPAGYPAGQRPELLPEAPRRAAAQHSPEHPSAPHAPPPHLGNDGGDADTNPHAYRTDPAGAQDPYAYPYPPLGSAAAGPTPAPAAAASNPYGSYVMPGSQQTVASRYDGYPAAPGNGHRDSYPPPAAPGDTGQAGNGYWQQPQAQNLPPDPAIPGYQDGHGRHGQARYLPDGYQDGQHDPAAYAPADPYRSNGYGDYPEYGAAGG